MEKTVSLKCLNQRPPHYAGGFFVERCTIFGGSFKIALPSASPVTTLPETDATVESDEVQVTVCPAGIVSLNDAPFLEGRSSENTGGEVNQPSRAAQLAAKYRNEHYGNPEKED